MSQNPPRTTAEIARAAANARIDAMQTSYNQRILIGILRDEIRYFADEIAESIIINDGKLRAATPPLYKAINSALTRFELENGIHYRKED